MAAPSRSDSVKFGAECAAQADLAAAFKHGDDREVGDADRADEQRDRAEAEEEGGGGAGDGDAGGECLGGRLTDTSSGASGLAVGARRSATPTTWLVSA